ncbi:hypothetical protein ASG67_15460 [Sphingomonas sp. Leaf339]|nr:hypothetical protein ASG67_15460 [Sphingomonas sp. Leaf339]
MFMGTALATGFAALSMPACAQRNGPARRFDVQDFGALGDGKGDDGPAFQRAIDAAAAAGGGTVRFGPGIFALRLSPGPGGNGGAAFTLRSGVRLEGADRARSVLRLADGQLGPGTFLRIIASEGTLENAGLSDFTLDANRTGQGEFRDASNGGAIVLGWGGRCTNVSVERVTVRGANGQGMMLLGAVGNPGRALRVADCLVERASYIGIQSSQFDGLVIERNTVTDCVDNGIDVYGNDDANHSIIATSHRGVIRGNVIRRCGIGIFLETVADCQAVENDVTDCRLAGLRINRINGEPRNLLVARNRFAGSPFGVAVGGDTGGVEIRDNTISGFTTAGVQFTYNVSHITVAGNRFLPAKPTVPVVLGQPIDPKRDPQEQLAFVTLGQNSVPRGHRADAMFVNNYKRQFMIDVGRFVPTR